MAENTEFFCRAVAQYIGDKLGTLTEYFDGIPWQERERMFDAEAIHILWICGLPYIHKAESLWSRMELLAVPVPVGERYYGLPIYFSDVVVHRGSRFLVFSDLRGKVWAFNEPRSHSGYNVVRAHLANLGARTGFFAYAVESGAHMDSLRMILDRRVDGAAIDSTVLDWAVEKRPEIPRDLRVIGSLGPSPIPPRVISKSVPADLRRIIRAFLLDMHCEPVGMTILRQGRIKRFVASEDRDYDPVRRMARRAESVALGAA
jgi:phosphonate transport system substrate-binding protein